MLKVITLLLMPVLLQAQHPITFFTRSEALEVKKNLLNYPLLKQSWLEITREVDQWIGKEVDVPVPKDAAGGYTHDRHKANYTLMFNSGLLYQLTGDLKYAGLVKQMFLKYADLNPTLKKHPKATSNSPGHIFWQALNDANWLVYTGMAYDLIYNSLSTAERKKIEDGAFKPEVEFMTRDLENWFNLIHNHGVWACAGVGIVGIATNNRDYLDMALYGTTKDGKSGYIAQLNGLFSPDGYYTEGPYYVRYALLPFYVFANALQHARPDLKIFEHRGRILQKALMAALQQTNINGSFYPLNDALKDKDYTSNELVVAVNLAWEVYGSDPGLLFVAQKQKRVSLSKGGISIAASLASNKNIPAYFPYRSIEFKDGVNGDEGGISLLRIGNGGELSSLIYKYTSHGLSHGHFDKLNINLFDQGKEILTDYGAVRFIGVEQKNGGRYLPETDGYASQTIAHNTMVVDETSHFGGRESLSEQFHSEKLFSNILGNALQVVAARENNAYKEVRLQRTVYLFQLPGEKKFLVDVFNASSGNTHQYDLPFHFNGQLIHTSFPYESYTHSLETLGKENGYQYLWKEASAVAADTMVQFTFLNSRTYYSVSSLVNDSARLYFARTGANDPNFNLRHEPVFVIRKKGKDQIFVNVVEKHGRFDPVNEFSTNSYPTVQGIRLLQNDEKYTLAEIMIGDKKLLIAQCNSEFEDKANHSVMGNNWSGPYAAWYDGKPWKGSPKK